MTAETAATARARKTSRTGNFQTTSQTTALTASSIVWIRARTAMTSQRLVRRLALYTPVYAKGTNRFSETDCVTTSRIILRATGTGGIAASVLAMNRRALGALISLASTPTFPRVANQAALYRTQQIAQCQVQP